MAGWRKIRLHIPPQGKTEGKKGNGPAIGIVRVPAPMLSAAPNRPGPEGDKGEGRPRELNRTAANLGR